MKKEGIQTRKRKQKSSGNSSQASTSNNDQGMMMSSNSAASNQADLSAFSSKSAKNSRNGASSSASNRKSSKLNTSASSSQNSNPSTSAPVPSVIVNLGGLIPSSMSNQGQSYSPNQINIINQMNQNSFDPSANVPISNQDLIDYNNHFYNKSNLNQNINHNQPNFYQNHIVYAQNHHSNNQHQEFDPNVNTVIPTILSQITMQPNELNKDNNNNTSNNNNGDNNDESYQYKLQNQPTESFFINKAHLMNYHNHQQNDQEASMHLQSKLENEQNNYYQNNLNLYNSENKVKREDEQNHEATSEFKCEKPEVNDEINDKDINKTVLITENNNSTIKSSRSPLTNTNEEINETAQNVFHDATTVISHPVQTKVDTGDDPQKGETCQEKQLEPNNPQNNNNNNNNNSSDESDEMKNISVYRKYKKTEHLNNSEMQRHIKLSEDSNGNISTTNNSGDNNNNNTNQNSTVSA